MNATGQDTMPRRAYSYKRVSQGKQQHGDGLDRQDDYAEQLAARNGWCLDDTLRFVDKGRSGFHGANLSPAADLTRFLDLVTRGRITAGSVLIVENLDRLSRQDVDVAYDVFRGLIRAGIWIATKMPERIYTKESNSFMDLMEPIWLMYLAHQESAKKSERVKHAWEAGRIAARDKNTPHQGTPPAWLRREGEGWAIIPERAEVVRRIAALARSGSGLGRIAQILNQEGETSLTRSGTWTGPAVHQLLVSRHLLGEYHPHRREGGKRVPDGQPIVNYYPAVLTEDEYQATRAALSSRRHCQGRPARGRTNLFTGLAWDTTCNRRVSLQTVGSHGKRIRYLSVGQVAGCFRARYEDVELCVLDTLAQLRPEDVLEPSARQDEREHRIAALTGRAVALDHRQRQLQREAADPGQDVSLILPILRQVGLDLAATSRELETLKMEGRSGRAEALLEAQTLRQLRDQASGEERAELDRRIKAALPAVISRIDLRAERLSARRQIVHVAIRLRSGNVREVQLLPSNDLIGDRARGAKPA